MNYDEKAREVLGKCARCGGRLTSDHVCPTQTKSKNLFPVPADLEAAMREGIAAWIGPYETDGRAVVGLPETHAKIAVVEGLQEQIVSAVAPLLHKWQTTCEMQHDSIVRQEEKIEELEAEYERQRDYINYVDDCYFLWSKKHVHVQPHFYSGWLVDRPMFVAILEEAKESPDLKELEK